MRLLPHFVRLGVVLGTTLWAQPPLIDRELFFDDPEISGAQLSPDGKYLAFQKPLDKVRNIWVKGATEPFSAARPVTAETKRPVPGYFWSRDGRYILFAQDKDGDENYNVYAVNPAGQPESGAKAPAARNLSNLQGVRVLIYSVPKSDPDSIYVGLNDRDKAWHDLYRLKLSTGEKTLIRKNTERIAAWIFDLSGQLRLAMRTTDKGDSEILRVDKDAFTQIYSCSVLEACYPARFHKDGKRVYLVSNRGENVDLSALMLLDTATGKAEPVESDPNHKVDFGFAMFSEKTDELIATSYTEDKQRYLWKDKAYEADYRLLTRKLAGKQVNFGGCTLDESLCLVNAGSDVEPGETYLFNRKTKDLALQYRVREKIPREALAAMETIRYKSSDGLEIPAYLTVPKGAKRPMPLVVVPHGGPWGRDTWGYNGLAQFLANRGYAVLRPNFRASTGFGKRFLNLGNGKWGETMQDDITWGVKHLVAQGVADPKRVGILGGSYGGYATLAGVAFTPDLYAAAVAIVAPSNLITLLDSIPPYWEAGRKIMYTRMADPTTKEGRALLAKQSPLNSADKIKTPLMVVQGANDPRVNKAESDQIVIALRERKFPVEYLVAPDEGHGFARPVNNLAMYFAAEEFLAKHLGGRYQKDAKPEVAARLKEITVDPATVVLAKKVDAAAVGIPQAMAELAGGTREYRMSVTGGPKPVEMKISSVLKEDGGNWVVTDTMTTPAGEVRDEVVIARSTRSLVSRKAAQGPVGIELAFNDGKATGKMSMSEKDRPIAADLSGPIFPDSAGFTQSIAALPLKAGYSTRYRTFDLMRAKEKMMDLRVVGEESVSVPAGSFEAWKVEVTPAEGAGEKITAWVAKKEGGTVKMTRVPPQPAGVMMTVELVR